MKTLTFAVSKVTVVSGMGCDKIYVHTDTLSPTPNMDNELMSFRIDAEAGTGVSYTLNILSVPKDLIELVEI